MKKILILSYQFPPSTSVSAQRAESWWRFFHELGYHPVVVTRHWNEGMNSPMDFAKPSQKREISIDEQENATVIRVPFTPNLRDQMLLKYGIDKHQILRKALTAFYSVGEHAWMGWDSQSGMYQAANDYLNRHECVAILATAEPFIVFKYAHLLSKKHGLPWVADFQDGWSTCTVKCQHGLQKWLKNTFYKRFETRYLSNASGIVTAAPSYQAQLQALHTQLPIEVNYYGYCEEEMTLFKKNVLTEISQSFDIGYAGSIYGYQPLELFLEGYQKFLKEEQIGKGESRVIFYGANFYEAQKSRVLAFDEALHPYITTTDRLPKMELFEQLVQCAALLLFGDDTEIRIPSKVFEYLPLQRPVLLVRNDRAILEKILTETESGRLCDTADDVCRHLRELYYFFKKNRKVMQVGKGYETYSNRQQARKVIAFLEKI